MLPILFSKNNVLNGQDINCIYLSSSSQNSRLFPSSDLSIYISSEMSDSLTLLEVLNNPQIQILTENR
jgi:hypothetical protein